MFLSLVATSMLHAGPPIGPLPPGAILRLGSLSFRSGDGSGLACFAGEGRLLAGDGKALAEWDIRTGGRLRVLRMPDLSARRFVPQPGESLVASFGFGEATVFDARTGKLA